MICRILDYPTRVVVASESDGELEYHVDLCEYPVGTNPNGTLVFNGACGLGNERFNGCKEFIYRCEPKLKKPENLGKIFRCKHIREARANVLDYLLPVMKQHDPNLHENDMT